VDRIAQASSAPRHYVVFRETTTADRATATRYHVPGAPLPLDKPAFSAWLRGQARNGRPVDLVAVLVIQEALDEHGSIVTCRIERRRGSATGPFLGDPARVTFVGAVQQVRLYRSSAHGTLREVTPNLDGLTPGSTMADRTMLDRQPVPPSRVDHLAGEARAVRDLVGGEARILDAREPTVLEALVGLSSIMHLRTPDGVEIDCGLGWHGTTPFVLQADFPRFGALPILPAADAAAIAMAAVTAGLTLYETRGDASGPAVVARSRRDGAFHLIRPDTGGPRIEAYTPGVPSGLFNADQAVWVRYATTHENLALIDAYRDGRSGNIFVLAGRPDGRVTRHLIDADGTEVWCADAEETAAAARHRERVIATRRD
jgi:hypothetical protein